MAVRQPVKKWITLQNGLDNLTLQDASVPDLPGADEVLVEIRAVSLNYRDPEGILLPLQRLKEGF
jgi:NADPH:quinone reductase-like Zn-dependent oxidoreductase